jgi:hypothetical protein
MAGKPAESFGLGVKSTSQVSENPGEIPGQSKPRHSFEQVDDADAALFQPIRPISGYSESSTLNASSGKGSTDMLLPELPDPAASERLANISPISHIRRYADLSHPQKLLIDDIRKIPLNKGFWDKPSPTGTEVVTALEEQVVKIKFEYDAEHTNDPAILTKFEVALLDLVTVQLTLGPSSKPKKLFKNELPLNTTKRNVVKAVRKWKKAQKSSA